MESSETLVRQPVVPARDPLGWELKILFPFTKSFRLERGTHLIGRKDCDILLDHASVSRTHASLSVGSDIQLEDLNSANGVFVDRKRVTQTTLEPTSIVRIGDVVGVLVRRAGHIQMTDSDSALIGGDGLYEVHRMIRLLGPATLRILVTGQSGTGKELVARELHRLSGRSGPFIGVNCAAIPDHLVESELFGHVRGAFTGAHKDRPGLFESAGEGTLFLDEVAELPLASQAKLLRVLETHEVRRVGATRATRIACRVISATNRDVSADVQRERFRGDLYARLAEAEISLPALSQRIDDLPLLIDHLTQRAGSRLIMTADVIEALACHPWPLNVRELDNVLRVLAVMSAGAPVGVTMLPASLSGPVERKKRPTNSKQQRVIDALRMSGGNVASTSRDLGVSRSYIYRCLDRAGLAPEDLRSR